MGKIIGKCKCGAKLEGKHPKVKCEECGQVYTFKYDSINETYYFVVNKKEE